MNSRSQKIIDNPNIAHEFADMEHMERVFYNNPDITLDIIMSWYLVRQGWDTSRIRNAVDNLMAVSPSFTTDVDSRMGL